MITVPQGGMPVIERRVLDAPRRGLPAFYAAPRPENDNGLTALMVSGYVGSKEDFAKLLPLLADAGYHAWSYDQLGQYEAGGPEDPDEYTIDRLAGDLRSVIELTGQGRPVQLLGHCLGGFIARATAVADPAAVRSLTMVSCGPSMNGRRHRMMVAELDRRLEEGAYELLWPLIKRLVPKDDKASRDFWQAKLKVTTQGFMRGTARSMGQEPDRGPLLRTPLLVMHGKRDRRLWSRDAYAEMAGRLGAGLATIEGAAHSPHQERPEATAEVLLGFWSRLPVGCP